MVADMVADAGTDRADLERYVRSHPRDVTAQRVLADCITEQTGDYPAALRMARRIADEAIVGPILEAEQVQRKLDAANGRRRARTLSLDQVRACIRRALADGTWHACGGDTVANKYGYAAYRTICLAAVRTDGSVRVEIAEANAQKGSSLTNPLSGLTVKASDASFRAWADEQGGKR